MIPLTSFKVNVVLLMGPKWHLTKNPQREAKDHYQVYLYVSRSSIAVAASGKVAKTDSTDMSFNSIFITKVYIYPLFNYDVFVYLSLWWFHFRGSYKKRGRTLISILRGMIDPLPILLITE